MSQLDRESLAAEDLASIVIYKNNPPEAFLRMMHGLQDHVAEAVWALMIQHWIDNLNMHGHKKTVDPKQLAYIRKLDPKNYIRLENAIMYEQKLKLQNEVNDATKEMDQSLL